MDHSSKEIFPNPPSGETCQTKPEFLKSPFVYSQWLSIGAYGAGGEVDQFQEQTGNLWM
jgi:hypothetical protein